MGEGDLTPCRRKGVAPGAVVARETRHLDHTRGPQNLAQAGRDVERLALSRALRLVFEYRVFLCGNRTESSD